MSRRMPITPIARPSGSRRAEAFRLVGMTSPLALRGFRTTFRMTPRSTTSRSAAVNSRVSSGLMKRESDCSISSSGRKPRSAETASLACRIFPSRMERKTWSGGLLIKLSAESFELTSSRMSRRMPITPITLPSGSRRAEGVQARGDDLAARTARVQDHVPHDTPFNHFAQRRRELPRFIGGDEARERLLEHLILTKPEQLGNRIVRLQDLAFEVGDEHGVRAVGDDDVGIHRTVRFEVPAVTFDRGRLRTEFLPSSHSKPPSRPSAPCKSNWDSKRALETSAESSLSTLKLIDYIECCY